MAHPGHLYITPEGKALLMQPPPPGTFGMKEFNRFKAWVSKPRDNSSKVCVSCLNVIPLFSDSVIRVGTKVRVSEVVDVLTDYPGHAHVEVIKWNVVPATVRGDGCPDCAYEYAKQVGRKARLVSVRKAQESAYIDVSSVVRHLANEGVTR